MDLQIQVKIISKSLKQKYSEAIEPQRKNSISNQAEETENMQNKQIKPKIIFFSNIKCQKSL